MVMRSHDVRIPFDPDTEVLYCSRDGAKLEKSGHLFSEFMLCPNHGEFTIAPVVMREPTEVVDPITFKIGPSESPDAGKWFMLADATLEGMWNTNKALDGRRGTQPGKAQEGQMTFINVPSGTWDGANRYDTDDEHILHLWRGTGEHEVDGHTIIDQETFDLRAPRVDPRETRVI